MHAHGHYWSQQSLKTGDRVPFTEGIFQDAYPSFRSLALGPEFQAGTGSLFSVVSIFLVTASHEVLLQEGGCRKRA